LTDSTPKDDGGPAFPTGQVQAASVNGVNQVGMSLRDWFAGMVVSGFCYNADDLRRASNASGKTIPEIIAWSAYDVADAMLERRKK